MDVLETIRERYASFSSARKKIAAVILDHPSHCCFLSLREFAAMAGTTEVTVLNFCRAMGLESYIDLRKRLQEYAMQWTRTSDRLRLFSQRSRNETELYGKIASAERESVEATFGSNKVDDLHACIAMIRKARSIYIGAHNASRLASSYLSYRFKSFGVEMTSLDLSERAQTLVLLASLPPEEVLVFAIATPPYGKPTIELCSLCREVGIPVVSFTDSTLSPLVPLSRISFICPASEFFGGLTNSYASTIALMEALSILYHYGREEEADERGKRVGQYLKKAKQTL